MGITIKTISDFEKFKNFTTTPICYVYYKDSLLNVYYVGYTIQYGYKYLKNHHKMKKIEDVLNHYSIQIYTTYDEDSLIKFFKPKLNKIAGIGICGRKICKPLTSSVGEIIGFKDIMVKRKKKENYNSVCEDIWENLFKTNHEINYIHFGIIKYIIEQKINELSINSKEYIIIHHPIFKTVNNENINNYSSVLTISQILSILKFCKTKHIWDAYLIINMIYSKNISWHLDYINHKLCSCGKLYKNNKSLLSHIDQKHHSLKTDWIYQSSIQSNILMIHLEITIEIMKQNYLMRNIDMKYELSYYYKICLTKLNISNLDDEMSKITNKYRLNPYEFVPERLFDSL
jgi:hypothetical protein